MVLIQDPDPNDPFGVIIHPGNDKNPKQLVFEKPSVVESNAIMEELKSFAHSIRTNSLTAVTVEDGHDAMQVAYQILDQLNYSNSIFAT